MKYLNYLKRLITAKSIGSATVVNAGIITATFVIFTGVLAFSMFMMANAKLTTALQNASIAGAMYYKVTGGEPCGVVAETLRKNDAELVSCSISGKNVEVKASRIAIGPAGPLAKIERRALAGESISCSLF